MGNSELAGLRGLLLNGVLVNGLAAGFLGANLDTVGGNLHSFVVWCMCIFLCMHRSLVHHQSGGSENFGARAFVLFMGGEKKNSAS